MTRAMTISTISTRKAPAIMANMSRLRLYNTYTTKIISCVGVSCKRQLNLALTSDYQYCLDYDRQNLNNDQLINDPASTSGWRIHFVRSERQNSPSTRHHDQYGRKILVPSITHPPFSNGMYLTKAYAHLTQELGRLMKSASP